MARNWPTIIILILAGALTGCTSGAQHTPAEIAYVEQVQAAAPALRLDDAQELTKGREVCNIVSGLKPDERDTGAANLINHGYAVSQVKAATTHLCPELGVRI
jgi:hypothetical protein